MIIKTTRFAPLIFSVLLASCSPTLVQHGNLVSDDKLSFLKPNYHTKSDVKELLGPPSSEGVFDKTMWYYVGMSGEKLAFFKPDVTQEKTVKLVFNENDVLMRVMEYDPKDKEDDLSPNDRITVTKGHDQTVLEQIFGNFGRRYQEEKK